VQKVVAVMIPSGTRSTATRSTESASGDTADSKISADALICSTNWKFVNSSAPSIIRPSSRRNVLAVPSVENDGVLKVITNCVIAIGCAA